MKGRDAPQEVMELSLWGSTRPAAQEDWQWGVLESLGCFNYCCAHRLSKMIHASYEQCKFVLMRLSSLFRYHKHTFYFDMIFVLEMTDTQTS